LFSAAGGAYADDNPFVRITAVNGEPTSGPLTPLSVRPNDVITLSADVLTHGGGCRRQNGCAQNRYIEEFTWKADDRPGDECHPDAQKDCLSVSSFQLNDYGVSFYVPQNMGPELRITVSDDSLGSSDTILLTNAAPASPATPIAPAAPPPAVADGTQPPAPAVTAVTTPPVTVTNYDTLLVGQGRWVYISSVRYWVPYTYQADWAPYQNGYWTFVAGSGWTWVSYDPWGAYTDHYGVWRHHGLYGWVWLPFAHPAYVPAAVTWFYGPTHIGWYPYYPGYAAGFRQGEREGFNDGYWAGYRAGEASHSHTTVIFGLTAVHNVEFAAKNIQSVKVDGAVATTIWHTSAAAGHISPLPGAKSIAESKSWVEKRIGEPVPVTHLATTQINGHTIKQPEPIHPVPATYQHVGKTLTLTSAPSKPTVPLGSMVLDRKDDARVVPPTANGMALTHPPASQKGTPSPPPIRVRTPSVPHQDHPYFQRVGPGPKGGYRKVPPRPKVYKEESSSPGKK
jgi:hypothetical protein